MDINIRVNTSLRIRAFYLFFIIASAQVGVGLLGGPKYIYLHAKQDSWISILITYLALIVVLWVMFRILKSYDNADIFGIQIDIFGRWLGKLFGTLYILHFTVALITVLMTYIDVIQVFVFPEINTWIVGFLLLSLVVYGVAGGLRTTVGMVFLFFFPASLMILLLYKPISLIDYSHYQPVLQASIIDLLKGAKSTTFTFIGFEILFLVYPFIRDKNKVWRPAFLGVTWTVGIVLLTTLVTIGFYSGHRLSTMEWSVLSLFKVVELPFIARFDFIGVAGWMTVAVPNMMLLMWAITHGMKRIYRVPKKVTLYSSALIILVLSGFLDRHHLIIQLTDTFANIDFWIIFVYPLILLPIIKLKKLWQQRQKRSQKT